MAVRRFDGTDDVIVMEAVPWLLAGSVAVVWRSDTNRNNGLVCGEASGFERWADLTVASDTTYLTTGGPFVSGHAWSPDTWYLTVYTRPAGATQTVRVHHVPLASGSWTHANVGTLSDPAGGITSVRIGHVVNNDFWHLGEIAAVGLWDEVLSDGQCETMTGLGAMLALGPEALWGLTQEVTTDPVLDLSGNGWDQASLVGTTVVTGDDPPNFDLSMGPNEGGVDYAVDLTLATTGEAAHEGVTGHAVDLTLATTAARASEGVVDAPVDLSLATSATRASRGGNAWTVSLSLAFEGTDPANPPALAPPLTALGAHDRGLAAVGAHVRTLAALGVHPI